jgi:hypothetical protein
VIIDRLFKGPWVLPPWLKKRADPAKLDAFMRRTLTAQVWPELIIEASSLYAALIPRSFGDPDFPLLQEISLAPPAPRFAIEGTVPTYTPSQLALEVGKAWPDIWGAIGREWSPYAGIAVLCLAQRRAVAREDKPPEGGPIPSPLSPLFHPTARRESPSPSEERECERGLLAPLNTSPLADTVEWRMNAFVFYETKKPAGFMPAAYTQVYLDAAGRWMFRPWTVPFGVEDWDFPRSDAHGFALPWQAVLQQHIDLYDSRDVREAWLPLGFRNAPGMSVQRSVPLRLGEHQPAVVETLNVKPILEEYLVDPCKWWPNHR